jgi:hypothetical protein
MTCRAQADGGPGELGGKSDKNLVVLELSPGTKEQQPD